jgi:hypothetical protein
MVGCLTLSLLNRAMLLKFSNALRNTDPTLGGRNPYPIDLCLGLLKFYCYSASRKGAYGFNLQRTAWLEATLLAIIGVRMQGIRTCVRRCSYKRRYLYGRSRCHILIMSHRDYGGVCRTTGTYISKIFLLKILKRAVTETLPAGSISFLRCGRYQERV